MVDVSGNIRLPICSSQFAAPSIVRLRSLASLSFLGVFFPLSGLRIHRNVESASGPAIRRDKYASG
jgi:hypothetical protein